MDEGVAAALAELGYADCTATAFRPAYLAAGAPRLALAEPAWLRVGRRAPARAAGDALARHGRPGGGRRACPAYVHVYFHDTDLLDERRRRALTTALAADRPPAAPDRRSTPSRPRPKWTFPRQMRRVT